MDYNFFFEALWILILSILFGFSISLNPSTDLNLIMYAKMSAAIVILAALTVIIKSGDNSTLLIMGSIALGFSIIGLIFGCRMMYQVA